MADSGSSGGLQKLTITALAKPISNDQASPQLSSNKVTADFNPDTFTIVKGNDWTSKPDIGDDVPEIIFSGGRAENLELDLLFDSTGDGTDVRKKYEKLYAMAKVDPSTNESGQGQPIHVMVQWGEFISFVAVISRITQTFMMFKTDGTPLRARVGVCFTQVYDGKKKSGQNPTSRTETRRTWVVEQGQRLDWIAYQEYGDSSAWRHIAEANGILNPTQLRAGQILRLTPLT
jgi:nucleoid-associated protein YgaU